MAGAVRPAVLVFDVNETLIDIEALEPLFARVFGRPGVLREWFGQLVIYSMTVTLANCYTDFFTLGQSALRMLAEIHGVELADGDAAALADAMATMPAHPDVAEGLSRLRDDGYRLVALTNSPIRPDRPTALQNAGLEGYFERRFSVDELRLFKPATRLYQYTARELDVRPSACMMVAAHAWDIIGARSAGFGGALITRAGNAPLRADGVPHPDVIAADLVDLARHLAQAFEK
ncbi:haloacid dehalogenase type II [Mycolicibacter sinensis]|jgi:2-haloacid dehalogenase|uniref:Haloacid dehalogenase, type II n=1 Tax=Mycolicibacter sinensis (strain JDM601) TaxID=875328 RepID=A0A1A2EGD3_MYCSD|nr:haloacid dehalogenase type II [Mycolicibacter sinensis]OBG01235.1 haloacid dehalogenase, type II [Mycolicibacter sinensis]OBG03539.1 haloacid dehalogenase, type II [Mycolicibacter sinensis]